MAFTAALLGLAQLAPSIMGLFTKNETAGRAAEVVSSVARTVTGKDTDDGALEALKANPALLVEYQRSIDAHALAMYQEETKRLATVNDTMRAEYASGDKYTSRWRPTFGYAACATWVLQGLIVFGVVAYVVVADPARMVEVIRAIRELMQAMAEHWLYALAVLGVAVWKRSDDKKVAAGQSPAGPLAAIAGLFKK